VGQPYSVKDDPAEHVLAGDEPMQVINAVPSGIELIGPMLPFNPAASAASAAPAVGLWVNAW
jgi:hypothetical protein